MRDEDCEACSLRSRISSGGDCGYGGVIIAQQQTKRAVAGQYRGEKAGEQSTPSYTDGDTVLWSLYRSERDAQLDRGEHGHRV